MIPQTAPKATYDAYKAAYDQAVCKALASGHYILGEEVAAFEQEFAAWIGAGHAVGVANGTQAVELALRAVGVGPGDRVLTVSHTAVATAVAIVATGAEPVWVDVDPATLVMAPASLEAAIATARQAGYGASLKAVVAVHLYGNPVDLTAIQAICAAQGLRLVEDCAQAHGATWQGRRVGTFGAAAAFSFYPTKNLPAFGDGGAVCTDDPEVWTRLRALRQYGWERRYISDTLGLNSRLDELQAALLRVSLAHLDTMNAQRGELAALYDRTLAGAPGLALPQITAGGHCVYHQYVVRTPRRDPLMAFLREREIHTGIHYPVPIHRQPAFAGCDPAGIPLPATENAAEHILSLPLFPQLSPDDAGLTAAAILEFLAHD